MKTVIKYLIIIGILSLSLSCSNDTTPPLEGTKAGNGKTGDVINGIPPTQLPKTFPVPSREVRSWETHSRAICDGHCLAFTPDGQLLASGSYDNTIKLWQVSTGQLLNTLSGYKYDVTSVAISPDGQWLASGSYGSPFVWQVSTDQSLKTLTVHGSSMWSVAISPDGRLASGGTDGVIKLWE